MKKDVFDSEGDVIELFGSNIVQPIPFESDCTANEQAWGWFEMCTKQILRRSEPNSKQTWVESPPSTAIEANKLPLS